MRDKISISVHHQCPPRERAKLRVKENDPTAWTKRGKAKIPRKSGVTEIKIQSMKVNHGETISIRVNSTESIMMTAKLNLPQALLSRICRREQP